MNRTPTTKVMKKLYKILSYELNTDDFCIRQLPHGEKIVFIREGVVVAETLKEKCYKNGFILIKTQNPYDLKLK